MTYLRYFLPLIIEGNKKGIKSFVYYGKNQKYNNPVKYLDDLKTFSSLYEFKLLELIPCTLKNPTFFVEGEYCKNIICDKKISLTYMTDFRLSFEKYIDNIDYCVFPSRFFASLGGYQDHPKAVFYGSPKYDIKFDSVKILEKYNLPKKNKYIFMPMPRMRDCSNIDLNSICDIVRDIGFKVITKTRGKDPYKINSDYHFMDKSWFPHDSMELIYVSDMVINFSSTITKEVLMLKKKMLNFDIKPFPQRLIKFYQCKNFKNIDFDFNNHDLIKSNIKNLLAEEHDYHYYIKKFLSTGNSSKRIINRLVLNEY